MMTGSGMRQAVYKLSVETTAQGLHEIIRPVVEWVIASGISSGLLTLFIQHTSASLLVQENAAPAAQRDLERYFSRLAPESTAYEHDDEGPDDMPAHLRAALTSTSLTIPVLSGRPALGTWQGVYLFEHRASPHRRTIALHLVGE